MPTRSVRALLIAVVLVLALPTAAAAMTRDEALLWGTGVARNDCNSGPESWLCSPVIGLPFPKSTQVDRCNDTSRWCVKVLFVQWDPLWPAGRTQHCVTETHWLVSGAGLTYHSEGCIGLAGPGLKIKQFIKQTRRS